MDAACLEAAEAAGAQAGEAARERLAALAAEAGEGERPRGAPPRARGRARRRGERPAGRRTEALDLGLALVAAWLRDLAAVAEGADELVLNTDRARRSRTMAEGLDGRRARRGAELVMDTRRRLQVNVAEELALEALVFRLEALLRDA